MSEIIISALEIAYLTFVAFYIISALFIVYHLAKFGIGREPKIILFIFILGSAILLLLNINYYRLINLKDIDTFIKLPNYFIFEQ